MSRKIKDIQDKHTGELVYPRTHISAVVLTSDSTLEDIVEVKQDKLVSGTNIKTINGESILGSGDITIEGGSGSLTETVTSVKINGTTKDPSNGVVDLGYISKKLSTSTSSSMNLFPNIYYRNTSTSLSTLTIALTFAEDEDIINEYFVEFTTSSSGTTVSLPSTIKWANGEAPTFEASTTYQISIVNNLGVVTKFK